MQGKWAEELSNISYIQLSICTSHLTDLLVSTDIIDHSF